MTALADEDRQRTAALRAEVSGAAPGDAAGLFGPGSARWTLDRHLALALGGPRALLLQIAHPAVAAAVAQHSQLEQDPLGRAQRTLAGVFTVVFGDRAQALEAARRISSRHDPVHGKIGERSPSPFSGRSYRANDPELLLWVHATLIDTALQVMNEVVGGLEPALAHAYYQESLRLGAVLGIPHSLMPATYPAFRAYFAEMLQGPVLQVGDEARRQRDLIAQVTPSMALMSIYGSGPVVAWRGLLDVGPARRATTRLVHLLGAGMLPPRLRAAYGYPWGPGEQRLYAAVLRGLRTLHGLLPDSVRYAPGYHLAEARARSEHPASGSIRPP